MRYRQSDITEQRNNSLEYKKYTKKDYDKHQSAIIHPASQDTKSKETEGLGDMFQRHQAFKGEPLGRGAGDGAPQLSAYPTCSRRVQISVLSTINRKDQKKG